MSLKMNKKFKLPTKSDLKSRTSTISNAFAIAITPYIYPSQNEIECFFKELNLEQGQCAYCLDKANAMDHVKPLVTGGLPTGYITEIRNLVPCCSACNSAKGSQDFKTWYKSSKNVERLHSEGLTDEQIENRFLIISKYIDKIPDPIDYKTILGDKLWNEYLRRKNEMINLLKDDQLFCDKLNDMIKEKLNSENK